MRGTVSRTLLMHDVFVPAANEWMPRGRVQPGGTALPVAVPVAVPELPRAHRRHPRHHRGVPARRAARPGRRRPPRSPDQAARLGPDAAAPRAVAGAAVPRRSTTAVDRPDRGRPGHRLGGGGHGDGARRRGRVDGDQGVRRPVDAEVAAARAHVPRRPARQHDAAVERRGLPRAARPGPPVRRGRPRDRSPTRSRSPRDAIVDASIELLRRDTATTAFTMRRLGDALGTDPTAVYRHFRDKSELVRAVGDRLLREVPVGLDTRAPSMWRQTVVDVCTRLRDVLLRQPQLALAVRDAPPLDPGEFAITELLVQQFLRRRALDPARGARVPRGDRADSRLGRHRRSDRLARRRRSRAALRTLAAHLLDARCRPVPRQPSRRRPDVPGHGHRAVRQRPRTSARRAGPPALSRHRTDPLRRAYWRPCSSSPLPQPVPSPATTPPAPIRRCSTPSSRANTGHTLAYGVGPVDRRDRGPLPRAVRPAHVVVAGVERHRRERDGAGHDDPAGRHRGVQQLGPHRRRRDRRTRAHPRRQVDDAVSSRRQAGARAAARARAPDRRAAPRPARRAVDHPEHRAGHRCTPPTRSPRCATPPTAWA